MTPNLKKHTKAETLAVLNQRYEQRCTRQEIKTDQPETDQRKIALQRSLDAGLNVSRQYTLIQMALRQLKGANRLRLDLNASIETNRTALVTALTETIHGWQQQAMQTIAPSNQGIQL